MQRYMIASDGDHDYFIKVEDETVFYDWVGHMESGNDIDPDMPDFEDNRIDGRFTFTDPRND